MSLNLQEDEQVIISSGDVVWISDNGRKLDDFVLTSKGLYCCYKEKPGLFAKAEEMVYRFELSDIITDEEASHIEQVRAKNERCIQIEFKHGMEHFSFQRVPKKIMDDYFLGFQRVLGLPDLTTIQKARNKEMLTNIAGDVVEGVGTLLGAGSRALYDKLEQMAENSRTARNGNTVRRTSQESGSYTSSHKAYEYTYYEETGSQSSDVIDVEATVVEEPEEDQSIPVPPPVPPPVPQQVPYYLAIDGQPKGPFQIEEIMELAHSGQINRSTLAWTKGMDNWQAMDEIDGLRIVAENLPPVL